jgi:hypothetical protein
MSSYVSNNEWSFKTDVAEFVLVQRNVGFEPNDGRWIVRQCAEFYFGEGGFFRQRRPGRFLGTFDDAGAAMRAVATATRVPVDDRLVR